MNTSELSLKLEEKCEIFAQKLQAMDTRSFSDNKCFFVLIETNISIIEFRYALKSTLLCPPSTLYVRIYPVKNNPVFFSLSEITDENDFRCTVFPNIENEKRLNACFESLCAIVEDYADKISNIALTEGEFARLEKKKKESIKKFGKLKESDILVGDREASEYRQRMFSLFEMYTVSRLSTFDGYVAFLNGNFKKAEKQYRKLIDKDNELEYEKRIYDLIISGNADKCLTAPDECFSNIQLKTAGSVLNDFKVFLCCFAGSAAIMMLITFAVSAIRSRGTVYYDSSDIYIMSLMLSLLAAIFGSISLRRPIMKKLFGKKAESELEKDDILNTKKWNKLYNVIFSAVAAACVYFNVLFALSPTCFYSDRMLYDDGSAFPRSCPVEYRYEDIEAIYRIEGRYNAYDEFVSRGSYILIFSDGEYIDLDSTISDKKAEKNVIPLLLPYADKTATFESDRALAELDVRR